MASRKARLGIVGMATAVALGVATPLVADFEGLRLGAYLDPVGIPTACYGTTRGVKLGQQFTKEQCDILLSQELSAAIATVDRYAVPKLTQYQYAAFGSFVYNVGEGNFKNSTLLRLLNAGDIIGACNQLPRWVYAKGIKLPGLVRRREAERRLCLYGLERDV